MVQVQVDLPPKVPLKWLGDYPKQEEYVGFTSEEWNRLVGFVNEKIIELQNIMVRNGRPMSATKELYPATHRLFDKLQNCMVRSCEKRWNNQLTPRQ